MVAKPATMLLIVAILVILPFTLVWPQLGRPLYLDALGLPLLIGLNGLGYWLERKRLRGHWWVLLNLVLLLNFCDNLLTRLPSYSPTFIYTLRILNLVGTLLISILLVRDWFRRR